MSGFLFTYAFFFTLLWQTIDRLIETGDSEQIFQKAIQEQGRGQVCALSLGLPAFSLSFVYCLWG